MNKQEFLMNLHKGLSGLPKDDIEERLNFYSEIIDDKVEEGASEEDAVAGIGDINEIISQIIADIPITKLVKEKITPKKKLKAFEIVLLILGSPIWFSLLVAAFAVILSLYVCLWSLIISLWAIFASVIGSAIGGIITGIWFNLYGNALTGIAMLGTGFVCAGLSIFLFFGCKWATKGILLLTKIIVLGIKNCFIKKEEA